MDALDLTNADWDAYLAANPDVAASGMDAATHWNEFGQHETGRSLGFQPNVANQGQFYNQRDGTPIGATNAEEMAAFVASNGAGGGGSGGGSTSSGGGGGSALPPGWVEQEYLALNPDVAAAVGRGEFTDGWNHFQQFGMSEDRFVYNAEKNHDIDRRYYYDANPDVAASPHTAGDHWALWGRSEGRDPMGAPKEDPYKDQLDSLMAKLNGLSGQMSGWGQQQRVGSASSGSGWGWGGPGWGWDRSTDPSTSMAAGWNSPYNSSPTLPAMYRPNSGAPTNGFNPMWNGDNPFALRTG